MSLIAELTQKLVKDANIQYPCIIGELNLELPYQIKEVENLDLVLFGELTLLENTVYPLLSNYVAQNILQTNNRLRDALVLQLSRFGLNLKEAKKVADNLPTSLTSFLELIEDSETLLTYLEENISKLANELEDQEGQEEGSEIPENLKTLMDQKEKLLKTIEENKLALDSFENLMKIPGFSEWYSDSKIFEQLTTLRNESTTKNQQLEFYILTLFVAHRSKSKIDWDLSDTQKLMIESPQSYLDLKEIYLGEVNGKAIDLPENSESDSSKESQTDNVKNLKG